MSFKEFLKEYTMGGAGYGYGSGVNAYSSGIASRDEEEIYRMLDAYGRRKMKAFATSIAGFVFESDPPEKMEKVLEELIKILRPGSLEHFKQMVSPHAGYMDEETANIMKDMITWMNNYFGRSETTQFVQDRITDVSATQPGSEEAESIFPGQDPNSKIGKKLDEFPNLNKR